jgi:hypothetical protein
VVTANATAVGGAGGASSGGAAGSAGNATARSSAAGSNVASHASATSGASADSAGVALATAIGDGTSGSADAHAATGQVQAAHVTSMTADASADVSGMTSVTARALMLASSPGFITDSQAVAVGTALPNAGSVSGLLGANPTISAAFGATPTILASEELGGGYSSSGSGSEVSHSTVELIATLDSQDLLQHLQIGLFNGQSFGSGVSGVTLDITANGTGLLHQDFGSGTAAAAYFADNAIDLGTLSASAYSSGSLDLQVSLQVATDSAGSGFYGGLLVSG